MVKNTPVPLPLWLAGYVGFSPHILFLDLAEVSPENFNEKYTYRFISSRQFRVGTIKIFSSLIQSNWFFFP